MGKRRIIVGIIVGITLSLINLGTGALAQPAPGQEAVELEPVVISATGTEVPTKESTQSVTVITEKEMQDRQAIRVEEMLRYVPGVTMSQTGARGGTTSLFLRGGELDHTQVLFNGIRLNVVGGSFDFNSLTTDNLSRIEVVRGPMSALYGTDAMTGVVSLFTKKGAGPPTLTLSSGWGPHYENGRWLGEQRASLAGSYKRFSYSVGFSRIDDPGILLFNNSYYNNSLVGRLDLDLRDNLSVTHHTLLTSSRYGICTENSGDVFDPKPKGGPGLDPGQNQFRFNLLQGLTFNYWPFKWWENALTLAYVQQDLRFNDPANLQYSDFDLLFGSYRSRDLERRFSLDYRSNLRFGAPDQVQSISTLGVLHRDDQLKQWTWSVSPWWSSSTSLTVNRKSTAFFAQEQLNLFNRVFLVGGFRVEDNSAFPRTEFIPRGSVAVRFPRTDTTIRAAGGRAIKEPTLLETYARSQFTAPNPNLKPEQNVSWEVGLDQYLWNNRLTFSATYFENHFSNFITLVRRPWPLLSQFDNIGAVRVNGLELALRARPVQGLTLGLVYTNLLYFKVTDDEGLNNIYFKTGEKLLRRPRHAFNFVVDYVYDRLNLNLTGLYIGRRDDSQYLFTFPFGFQSLRVTNGDYFILNLAASYDLVRDFGHLHKVQLWARLNNLTNRRYMEAYGYSSPRFFMVGGLRVVFGLKPAGEAKTPSSPESAPLLGASQ